MKAFVICSIILLSSQPAFGWHSDLCKKSLIAIAEVYLRLSDENAHRRALQNNQFPNLDDEATRNEILRQDLRRFGILEQNLQPAVKKAYLQFLKSIAADGWPVRLWRLPLGLSFLETREADGTWKKRILFKRNGLALLQLETLKRSVSADLTEIHGQIEKLKYLAGSPLINADSFYVWLFFTLAYRQNASPEALLRQLQEANAMNEWEMRLRTHPEFFRFRIDIARELAALRDEQMPSSFDFQILRKNLVSDEVDTLALIEVKQISRLQNPSDISLAVQKTSEKLKRWKSKEKISMNGIAAILFIQTPWPEKEPIRWERSGLLFKLDVNGNIYIERSAKDGSKVHLRTENLFDQIIDHLNMTRIGQMLSRIDLQTPDGRFIASFSRPNMETRWNRLTTKPQIP